MRLCNLLVKIEIPDDFTMQRQDRCLESVDQINLAEKVQGFVQQQLNNTTNLKQAFAVVEE